MVTGGDRKGIPRTVATRIGAFSSFSPVGCLSLEQIWHLFDELISTENCDWSHSSMCRTTARATRSQFRPVMLPLYVCVSVLLFPAGSSRAMTPAEDVVRVQGLHDLMYTSLPVNINTGFCFRVANASHELGCAGWTGRTGKPLVRAEALSKVPLDGDFVVVASAQELLPLLQELLEESDLAERCAAVLVTNYTADGTGPPQSFSPAPVFPGELYAPYSAPGYEWNPHGTGASLQLFNFSVVMLDADSSVDAIRRADANSALGYNGALHVASVESTMQSRGTSLKCIEDRSCLPLGGHSVWAALPPLPPVTPTMPTDLKQTRRDVLLVVAQKDSDGFFKHLAQGADSALSGLIALLVAADALSQAAEAETYDQHVVFAPLAGEPWDFMGSRKLLWDLSTGADTVQPLNLHKLAGVVEIGAVGNSGRGIFLHRQRDSAHGDASHIAQAFLAAANGEVPVSEASEGNPGIPPSSLMAFLRNDPSTPGMVVTQYDSALLSPFYRGFLDSADPSLFGGSVPEGSGVSAAAISGTGILTARALHTMAGGTGVLEANSTRAEQLAKQLIQCLLTVEPGLSCRTVTDLMTVSATFNPLPHHVGVLHQTTADPQDPQPSVKTNTERFLWSFLADVSGTNLTTRCEPNFAYYKPEDVCGIGEVCVGWKYGTTKEEGHGWCYRASVKFVPTHSTRLVCEDCDFTRALGGNGRWRVLEVGEEGADLMGPGWPGDPVWSESNWPSGTPEVRLYQQEPMSTQYAVLAAGFGVSLATAVALWLGGKAHERHAKRQ